MTIPADELRRLIEEVLTSRGVECVIVMRREGVTTHWAPSNLPVTTQWLMLKEAEQQVHPAVHDVLHEEAKRSQ